jgi:hypothetical protein
MDKELQSIFESLDSQIFTDELKTAISTVLKEAVEKKVSDRIDLELQQMDESHAEKTSLIIGRLEETFNKYREQVDVDHCKKMLDVKKTLEESYGKKLLVVKEAYEGVLKKDAIATRDQLVEAVDGHLTAYLEKAIPREKIEEAAKTQYVKEQLDNIRRIAGVDKSMLSENVKQGIIQGKNQMDKLVKENAELKRAKDIAESKKVLAEKTAHLPTEQAKFVRSKLEGKKADFINENISYVLDMFARQENTERHTLLKEHKVVEVDRAQIVADETVNKIQTESVDPLMGMYLQGMNFRK